MIDRDRIQAITLDLDDTLWPVMPTMHRAEALLREWFDTHAPATGRLWRDRSLLQQERAALVVAHDHMAHDLTFQRRELIRRVLRRAGEDEALLDPAFDVFFAARQVVDLYAAARPFLQALAQRWPVVAVSNGNADLHRVGLAPFFAGQVSARRSGFAKPDLRIFHEAAWLVGVPTRAVLHVGDDAALDGGGALRCGMQMAWLNREGLRWPLAETPTLEVRGLDALAQALGLAPGTG